ncbi:MAG: 3-hydroxyacyl-CoA dehydrogenase family protein [Planctomycetota bacterium]
MKIKRIAVLGAGTMGHGIAQVSAMSGFQVRLHDIDASRLETARQHVEDNLQKGIDKGKVTEDQRKLVNESLQVTTDLGEATGDAEMVIEAAPERLELKKEIFTKLAGLCSNETILATNTSSLPVTEIASHVANPGRVIGMHFFNPPHILKLLELVTAIQTTSATLEAAQQVGEKLGKEVIVVKDSPGFATSRLGVILALEAIRMVEAGVASPEDIDKAMTLGYNHPMGPLRLTDLVGLDVRLAIADHLHREIGGDQYQAPPLLRQMVRAGKLGKKSGEGFYRWS